MIGDWRPTFIAITKTLMRNREWTQIELCKRANMSASSVSELLNGEHPKSKPEAFIPLFEALDYPPFAAVIAAECSNPPLQLAVHPDFYQHVTDTWNLLPDSVIRQPSQQAIDAFCMWCEQHMRKWTTMWVTLEAEIDDLFHTVRVAHYAASLDPEFG
jgi:transcriptional regulator with XRE-family HTH domain